MSLYRTVFFCCIYIYIYTYVYVADHRWIFGPGQFQLGLSGHSPVPARELTAPSEPIASARRARPTKIQCKSGSSLKPPGHGQQGRARANRPSDGKGYGH